MVLLVATCLELKVALIHWTIRHMMLSWSARQSEKLSMVNYGHRGLSYSTLQVATILVAMASRILKLVTWFVKKSPGLNLKSWSPNGNQAKTLTCGLIFVWRSIHLKLSKLAKMILVCQGFVNQCFCIIFIIFSWSLIISQWGGLSSYHPEQEALGIRFLIWPNFSLGFIILLLWLNKKAYRHLAWNLTF